MPNPKVVRRFPIKSAGKLYYGPWPSVEMLRVLKEHNVDTIWNLAEELNVIIPYEKYFVPNVIHGNIEDFYIPENMTGFATQLTKIANLLKSGKNIFVHCFGGHGRTGMALAAIDMMVSDSDPKTALRKAYGATGGPEELSQVDFIKDLYLFLQGKPIPKKKKRELWPGVMESGGRRGYFKSDPTTGRLMWVEETAPHAGKEWWEEAIKGQSIKDPYSGELFDEPPAYPKKRTIIPPPIVEDPGQSLSFMEWWGKHPEYKDYDAAKAYWAKEQKEIRKKRRYDKVQPEFCPYCGAHLMYPRDIDHIAKHFETRKSPPAPQHKPGTFVPRKPGKKEK